MLREYLCTSELRPVRYGRREPASAAALRRVTSSGVFSTSAKGTVHQVISPSIVAPYWYMPSPIVETGVASKSMLE